MYVTDTPVIDRLTSPGPMEELYRTQDDMEEYVLNASEQLQLTIDETVLPISKRIAPDLQDGLFQIAADLCNAELNRQLALVDRFADELATRLAAIA